MPKRELPSGQVNIDAEDQTPSPAELPSPIEQSVLMADPEAAVQQRSIFSRLRLRERVSRLRSGVAHHGGLRGVARKARTVLMREGPSGLLRRLRAESAPVEPPNPFADDVHTPENYVNEVVARRARALLSPWHIGLIRSRTVTPDPATLPRLTISAVTYNSEKWLTGFFASLMEQAYPLGLIDLVVADNGSTDSTVTRLREFVGQNGQLFHAVRVIQRRNDGFGAGHNATIVGAETDFVLVTNVDLLFDKNSILRAVLAAKADSVEVACWELAQTPYEHPKYYDPVTLETPWSAHACVLLRRRAFIEVGGYDDHIFMYGEDVELSYRLRGAGYLLRYLPWVTVTHFVDIGDTTARPRQLGGSLAAAVLLRYRYSTQAAAAAAERQLIVLAAQEIDPARRAGFAEAIATIRREKPHFMNNRKPAAPVIFPFIGFDYTMQRDGHDMQVASIDPTNAPVASVVTRTYGPALSVLGEAICTVLNQTYPEVEHVIVEDRGDHARAFVESVAAAYGRNLRYVASTGTGRSAAGNAGMAAAKGEFIVLLDNDDLLFADHLTTVVAPLVANQDVKAAYSLAWEAQLVSDAEGYRELMYILHPQFRLKYSRARLRKMNFIPIQAIAFRKDLFEKGGGFEEDLEALEDWSLWNNYARFGRFELVPRLTSLYHTPHDENMRTRRQQLLDDAYEPVRARIAERYREI